MRTAIGAPHKFKLLEFNGKRPVAAPPHDYALLTDLISTRIEFLSASCKARFAGRITISHCHNEPKIVNPSFLEKILLVIRRPRNSQLLFFGLSVKRGRHHFPCYREEWKAEGAEEGGGVKKERSAVKPSGLCGCCSSIQIRLTRLSRFGSGCSWNGSCLG
jgi:hypothetical protein